MEPQKHTLDCQKTLALKVFLSALSLFYILNILIFPNGHSYLGRTIGVALLPVANLVGLNTTWNFFSPDPANTMYFAYNIYFENDEGTETREPISGFLPSEKNQIVTDASQRRMLYAMRFLMLDEKRLNVFMAPWLCKSNPGASRVSIRSVVEKIPVLDDAIVKKSLNGELLRQEVESRSIAFDCRKPQDEISL